jgi:hypothetical protein
MLDVVLIGATFAFFAACVLYIYLCGRTFDV